MKNFRKFLAISAVSLFALQGLAATAQAAGKHAINNKGTGTNNGKAKTVETPADESAALPTGLGRWVPALKNGDCPKGSDGPYERQGDKCWVD
jgi:hypothetical protein